MDKLIIISCVGQKIWKKHPSAPLFVPAQAAYVSTYFLAMKNYAVMTGFPWLILSAKYGLLEPDHPICNYDVEMGGDGCISKESISGQVRHQYRLLQGKRMPLKDFKNICVVAGSKYAESVSPVYRDIGAIVSEPLTGCPIGVRISRLQNAAIKHTLLCNELQADGNADTVNVNDNHTADNKKDGIQQNQPVADEIHGDQGIVGRANASNNILPPIQDFHGGGVAKIREWVWKNVLKPNYMNLPLTLRAGDINTHLKLKQQMPQVCGALRGMHKDHPVNCAERRAVGKDGSNVWFTYTRRVP